jgi:hypothetical protein
VADISLVSDARGTSGSGLVHDDGVVDKYAFDTERHGPTPHILHLVVLRQAVVVLAGVAANGDAVVHGQQMKYSTLRVVLGRALGG